MKKRQGLLIMILTVILLISPTSSWAKDSLNNVNFKDTKATDWYMSTVSKLVELKGIAGFPDETFRPNLEIKKGEFIKTLIGSLGFNEEVSVKGHWASNYTRKAASLGIIDAYDFPTNKLNETITRYEMSKVIVKAIEYKGETHTEDRDKYISQIKDYNKIPNEYRDYVLKAYTKGLISGYPDGEFKGDKGLSRAEASAVIMRVLDPTERKVPEESKEPEKDNKTRELTEEDIKRLQGYEMSLSEGYSVSENGTKFEKKIMGIGFNDYDDDSAKGWIESLWNEILLPKNLEIYGGYFSRSFIESVTKEYDGDFSLIRDVREYDFFTSTKTVYESSTGSTGIRGILRVKYDKFNNEGLEINKYYERDITIYIKNSDYLDGKGATFKIILIDCLSPWKEVK